MALKRNNGTTDIELGKFFRNNGTNDVQIGKIYRSDGTADSLIYTHQIDLVKNGVSLTGSNCFSVGNSASKNFGSAGEGGVFLKNPDTNNYFFDLTPYSILHISASGSSDITSAVTWSYGIFTHTGTNYRGPSKGASGYDLTSLNIDIDISNITGNYTIGGLVAGSTYRTNKTIRFYEVYLR